MKNKISYQEQHQNYKKESHVFEVQTDLWKIK